MKSRRKMLPREFLREHAERLLREFPERYAASGLERFAELDRARREAVTRMEENRGLEEEVERGDAELAAVEQRIPNAPHASVPRGSDETANRVERTWGE